MALRISTVALPGGSVDLGAVPGAGAVLVAGAADSGEAVVAAGLADLGAGHSEAEARAGAGRQFLWRGEMENKSGDWGL